MSRQTKDAQPAAQAGIREAARVEGEVGVLRSSTDLWESTTHGERRGVTADPAAVESPDAIPPPLHYCIPQPLDCDDKPEWVEWLLDHGTNIGRREQDYGSTPLTTAVVHRQKRIIPILVGRGAKTQGQLKRARKGLAGAYEDSDSPLTAKATRQSLNCCRNLVLKNREDRP